MRKCRGRGSHHRHEALERRVDLLAVVAADPDGGSLGQGAEVVGLVNLLLCLPRNSSARNTIWNVKQWNTEEFIYLIIEIAVRHQLMELLSPLTQLTACVGTRREKCALEQAWKWHAATGTYSLLAITPAVSVVPLLPPHPTSITLHPSYLKRYN